MKCELEVIRDAGRDCLRIDSWNALMVRVVALCLITTVTIVAISITYHYNIDPINDLYVGCMFVVMAYLLVWHSCRKGRIV